MHKTNLLNKLKDLPLATKMPASSMKATINMVEPHIRNPNLQVIKENEQGTVHLAF